MTAKADQVGPGRTRRIGALFYHIRDAVAVLDGSWRIRRWNPAGERLFGYAEDRLLGQPFASLFDDAEEFARTRRLLDEGSDRAAGNLRSQIGRLVRVTFRNIPLDGDDGLPDWRAVLIQEEVPGNVDAAGYALIRQLHQLAEATSAIVAETDVVRVAQSLTDLAKVLLGADFAALVLVEKEGKSFRATGFTYNAPRELFPLDRDHPDPVGILGKPLETRSVVRIADVRNYPGSVGIPVHHPPVEAFLGVPLVARDAVLGELLVANRVERPAFSDLQEALLTQLGTIAAALLENARLRTEVANHADRVDQLNARRRSAMAAIAHDLRTPAGAVRGYAEVAADPRLSEGKRLFVLQRLEQQAQQLSRLIDDLGTASRLDTQNFAVSMESVDVNAILDEIRADYGARYSERPFEVAGRASAAARADRQRLRQVLTNLIDNAIKYSPEGGEVRCELVIRDGLAHVSVSDSGLGIDEADVPRLFTRFGRVVNRDNSHIPGTGLGLYLSRELARMHGGDINVRSRRGAGSTFTLQLPHLDASPPSPREEAAIVKAEEKGD